MARVLFAAVALGAGLLPGISRAQAVLIPQIGESRAEFEHRLGLAKGQDALAAAAAAGQRSRSGLTVLPDSVGQYFVTVSIAGQPVNMLVDTGATVVALSYEDAARLGMRPEAMTFSRAMETANGPVRAATTVLPMVTVGEIGVPAVDAIVLPRGSISRSLLGMSFLSRLRRLEILQGQLSLR